MGVLLLQVDAFTSEAFSGNPAAVCLLDGPADPGWMQAVAAEMNLSETAFVHPDDAGAPFSLRWFTPTVEVELCGHATLASAHVLWETGCLPRTEPARFDTRSGLLTATRTGDLIELDLPTDPVELAEADPALFAALGTEPRAVHRGRIGWILELADEGEVRSLTPDFRGLVPFGIVVVTSRADDDAIDFVSRCFGPAYGIDEDPVTGSSHCALAPYWSERLGTTNLIAFQASERGGIVAVRLAGERTHLGGHAVTVLRGELL
jgi:PhzF family phenazine biosynthesis protein